MSREAGKARRVLRELEGKFQRTAKKYQDDDERMRDVAVELKEAQIKYLKAVQYHAEEAIIASHSEKEIAELNNHIRSLRKKRIRLEQIDLGTFVKTVKEDRR